MQTKSPNNKKTTYNKPVKRDYALPGMKYWIVFFTTIFLLVAMTVSLVVMLCIEDGGDYNNSNSDKNEGNQNGVSGNGQIVNNNTNIKTKTGIVLPCATAGGKYLSSSASNVSSIEGINSDCAILVDIGSNVSVAEKNADIPVHPASLTKVMTLLVACENLPNAGALLTVDQAMLERREQLDGSGELVDNTSVLNADGDVEKIDIVGKSVTVEDALYLINYQSDTVACLMVAEYVAGSEYAFVQKMNAKAEALGLSNTKFVNCTGLTESSGEYNKTTAREMAAIMACALKNATAKKVITSNQKYEADIYEDGKKTEYTIPFMADWDVKRWNNTSYYEVRDAKKTLKNVKVLGGKTGYEDIPTSCFVTYARNTASGKEYVCVTIGKSLNSNSELVKNEKSTVDAVQIYKNYAK